jgi:hypothetical protein
MRPTSPIYCGVSRHTFNEMRNARHTSGMLTTFRLEEDSVSRTLESPRKGDKEDYTVIALDVGFDLQALYATRETRLWPGRQK